MATYVGLDPQRDIDWIVGEDNPAELFAEGKVDAFLAFPPEAQDLRARKVGHVILNSTMDRPWSQYYCCMLAVNAAYAEKYPVATKRVVRAILKIGRHLRGRAGAGGAPSGRWRTHRTVRLRAAVAPRAAVRQLARLRSRGHDPLLLAAAA